MQRIKDPNTYKKYWKHILTGVVSLGVSIGAANYINKSFQEGIDKALYETVLEEEKKLDQGILSINQYFDMQSHEVSFLAKQLKLFKTSEQAEACAVDFMQNNTEYTQLRILNQEGDELLRLFRKDGRLEVILKQDLQNKAHRKYFIEASKIGEFENYHSSINMGIEYGKPLEPLRVTLRHYSAFLKDGEKYLVGLNWDSKKLFSSLSQREIFLLDNDGRLLAGDFGELYRKPDIERLSENALITKRDFTMQNSQLLTIGTVRELDNYNEFVAKEKNQLYTSLSLLLLSTLGVLSFVYGSVRKKESEEALRESEEKFHKIFENRNDAIFVIDPENDRIVDANLKAVQMLRYDGIDELLSTSISTIHRDEMDRMMVFVDSIYKKGKGYTDELTCLTKDNTRLPAEISASVLEMQGHRHIIASVRDITERKHAEEVLRESEKQFRDLADSQPALIWGSGIDAKCNYFNEPWLDFTGRTLEQEMGDGWAEGVHPDDFERCINVYLAAFDKREPFEMEYRLRRHDGEYIWLFDRGLPLFSEDGEFTGYIGSCLDITENKQAEETIKRMREEQERFLRHELGNLHAQLRNYGKLFSMSDISNLNEDQKNYLSVFVKITERAIHLTDCIKTIHDFEAGNAKLNRVYCDLNSIIKMSVESMKIEGSKYGVQIDYNNNSNKLKMKLDLHWLPNVFDNLIKNAVEHVKEEDKADKYVKVDMYNEKDKLLVKINNKGKPISKDRLDRFFEKFNTLDKTGGSGLGTTYAYLVTKAHKGKIYVDSNKEDGTTVTLEFPQI